MPPPAASAGSGVRDGAEPSVSLADVQAAVSRIEGRVRRTPVLEVDFAELASVAGQRVQDGMAPLALKLESLQQAGSFKVRGAFSSALAQGVPADGLIAASGGNHGIAVAFVAKALGVRAEIFVPATASAVKVERIRSLGAVVHVAGRQYADAQAACDERKAHADALEIHPYDAVLTVAGQGTLGVELCEQVSRLDTVVVAVGGGGLAAGIASALPDHVRLVCVEPETACCLADALQAGAPLPVEVSGVAADSLGAAQIGAIAWELLAGRCESVTVSDSAILSARRTLWERCGLAVEPGAAAAFAAVQSGACGISPGERAAVVVCGANTDPADLTAEPPA